MSDCEHRDIQTWFFEDGDVAGTWSCMSCGHRFVPITELMAAEGERDEARAELARLTTLIQDEWSDRVQGDLENGVKWLNEQAAEKWRKEYPEIAGFGKWLEANIPTPKEPTP